MSEFVPTDASTSLQTHRTAAATATSRASSSSESTTPLNLVDVSGIMKIGRDGWKGRGRRAGETRLHFLILGVRTARHSTPAIRRTNAFLPSTLLCVIGRKNKTSQLMLSHQHVGEGGGRGADNERADTCRGSLCHLFCCCSTQPDDTVIHVSACIHSSARMARLGRTAAPQWQTHPSGYSWPMKDVLYLPSANALFRTTSLRNGMLWLTPSTTYSTAT